MTRSSTNTTRYLDAGSKVYEYQNHFNHLKMAVFDERWSNRRLDEPELPEPRGRQGLRARRLVDDEPLAKRCPLRVRDVDVQHSKRLTPNDLQGSLEGLRSGCAIPGRCCSFRGDLYD